MTQTAYMAFCGLEVYAQPTETGPVEEEIELQFATQTSNYNGGTECGAAEANHILENTQDESREDDWVHEGSCACMATDYEFQPFWEAVVKEGSYKVKEIQILGRSGDEVAAGQYSNLDIMVNGELCGIQGAM